MIGPAGSLGLFFNGPIGFIFLAGDLEAKFTLSEIRFIIAHEMSHIARSHSIATALASYFEDALSDIFSKELVDLFKALSYLSGQPVLNNALARSNELEADRDAVGLTGDFLTGISTLEKLATLYAKGNLDAPSHFALVGRSQLPAVTFRERIENLQSYPKGFGLGV